MNIDFPTQEPKKPTRSDSNLSSLTGCIKQIAFFLRKNTPPPPPRKSISWSTDNPPGLNHQIEVIAKILRDCLRKD